ncbi:type VI secretion system Vgr family protein [Paraburkholderia fungorum]|uniref:type VI secretion system Vgr family protein n=1 Tax=Paraburkholderia fungorum TaxID=134537 RepID=UPI0038BB3329
MADLFKRVGTYVDSPKEMTGRQSYFLDMPATANARDLSVVSFEAVERMGEPYRIAIRLTHPGKLSRSDYVGRDATFSIVPADAAPRRFAGCITRFSKLKTTKDFHSYEIVVEAHLARLGLVRSNRIYQQQTAPQIIETVLRRHAFEGHQFVFRLRRQYPQHLFRMQYQMTDLAYVQMLMQKEGIYSYITEGKHGDQIVFGDDIDHYIYLPELKVPYRETAGLEAGVEAVFALQTHAQTVPQSFAVADYNPDLAWERFRAEANVARKDATTYGQPYIYGTHHLDQDGAKWEAQLRHEAAIAGQVVHEGESNVLALQPGRILRIEEGLADASLEVPYSESSDMGALEDAPDRQVIVEVTHRGARDEAYRNTYRAIPSDRRFRLALEEDKWPKIPGTLSARVTSPGKYKYAYLTQQGYYTVRFDLDFDEWSPGGESVPLRLAKPFAGSLQTGFHFPAQEGTEAVIEFRDGDPDKPYISAFHHHSQAVDLITNQERWLSRNVIRTQANNKLRMEDWQGQESIKLSTEHSGKSQLNLGYLVDSRRQKRGEGFELRTSGAGAIRGGNGLFISADDQPDASGKQLDMQAAEALLNEALQQAQMLADAAQVARAHAAEVDKQRSLLNDTLKELKQAGVLVSAPAGVGVVSGDHLQLSAAQNLIATAGANADIGVLKRFTVAAGEAVSLFAQKLGMKLFASKGKVEIQAQGDAMELAALKDVTITSTDGKLILSAAKEVWIGAGGSYIKINASRIENGTPGDILEKCASWDKVDAVSMREAPPKFVQPVGCPQSLRDAIASSPAYIDL